jgi:hypothetical protein
VGADKILLFSRSGILLAKEPFGELVMLTPDGMHLLSAYSSTLFFFERNAGTDKTNFSYKKKWDYTLPASIHSIDISDNGYTIVASTQNSGTHILSSAGTVTGSDKTYSALVRVASNGGKILGVSATGLFKYSKTGDVTRYGNVSIGSEPDVMEITSTGATVIFNNDQRVLAYNTGNGVQRWSSLATGDVTSLAMTPTGSKILVGTENGHVDLFDGQGNLAWSYSSNPENKSGIMVDSVALSNDGKIAVGGTYDGKIVALNSAGREIWSGQVNDHIHYIAISADGSLVVATGEETVYAFSPFATSSLVPRTTVTGTTAAALKSVTAVPASTVTQNPVPEKTGTQNPEMIMSPTRTVTPLPTTYSVIRTATPSAVPAIIPLSALLAALLLVLRRR